jgi:non-heme chloroperoxidase
LPFVKSLDGTGYELDTFADDLAAVFEHFDLHDATLVAHSIGSKEAIRYLTRHGNARVSGLVLLAPTTPLLRRTPDNPDGLDPSIASGIHDAVATDVTRWCADFEAAGPISAPAPEAARD